MKLRDRTTLAYLNAVRLGVIHAIGAGNTVRAWQDADLHCAGAWDMFTNMDIDIHKDDDMAIDNIRKLLTDIVNETDQGVREQAAPLLYNQITRAKQTINLRIATEKENR